MWNGVAAEQQIKLIEYSSAPLGEVFLYFQSNKERDMRQLITLPMGELIPAKPALPVNVAQAQTIGCFR